MKEKKEGFVVVAITDQKYYYLMPNDGSWQLSDTMMFDNIGQAARALAKSYDCTILPIGTTSVCIERK